jgi:hypothetical protein
VDAAVRSGEVKKGMKEEMVVGLSAPGPVGRWGAAPPQAMLERMKDYGQEGAFALWDDLSPEDRELLVRDIEVSSCNAAVVPAVPGQRFRFFYFSRNPACVKVYSSLALEIISAVRCGVVSRVLLLFWNSSLPLVGTVPILRYGFGSALESCI